MESNSIIAKICKNGMLVLHKQICNPNDFLSDFIPQVSLFYP